MEERKEQRVSSSSEEETVAALRGRREDSIIHAIEALTLWLGAIHFIFALVLTAFLFLSVPVALTLVLLPFLLPLSHHPPAFVSFFFIILFYFQMNTFLFVFLLQDIWVAFSFYGDSRQRQMQIWEKTVQVLTPPYMIYPLSGPKQVSFLRSCYLWLSLFM